jgi:hypothetical protein
MNCLNFFIIVLYVLFSNYGTALAWDNIDLELFDLVEEVRTNFYEVLGVPQVSSFFFINIVLIILIGYRIIIIFICDSCFHSW